MSYEPTTWKSGDTVTSAKLNKIEQGIANAGVLIVSDNNGTLDHTYAEIIAGYSVMTSEGNYAILAQAAESEGAYIVVFVQLGQSLTPFIYAATSEDGYPVIQQ